MAFTLRDVARIPQTRAWKCLRKIHHASYADAEAHMREVEAKHGIDRRPLNVYRWCGDWHVGRSRQEEPRSTA